MASKPEIQYIGQFYVYGSEAKQLEIKEKTKKEKVQLPLPKFEKLQKIHVEPVAIGSILVAMALLFAMVLGAIQIQNAWAEYEVMSEYLTDLKLANAELSHVYHTSFDLAELEITARSLGLVPISELETISITVTPPEKVEEPSFLEAAWEDFKWFIDGLL